MTTFNVERFDALIRAARDADQKSFTMEKYAHNCGSPACIYGGFAARSDLQPILKLWALYKGASPQPVSTTEMSDVYKNEPKFVPHTHPLFRDYIGLTMAECEELFSAGNEEEYEEEDEDGDMVERTRVIPGTVGCGGATTPAEAVAYLEAFKARKLAEQGE